MVAEQSTSIGWRVVRTFLLTIAVVFGIYTALVVSDVVYGYGHDMTARNDTSMMYMTVRSNLDVFEAQAIKQQSFHGITLQIDPSALKLAKIDVIEVSEDGRITVKGGAQGQMFVLTPRIVGQKVLWRCLGGPNKAMMMMCRGNQDLPIR